MSSQSNLPLNKADLKEQFVYPKNEKLKESYIALLGMMKLQKKIRFYVHDCVFAICDLRGWISDYNPGSPKSKPDANYKKGLRFFKNLETPYYIFVGPGRVELCVYSSETKRRITSFDQFFKMCDEDKHMSEYSSCGEEVIFEPWNDVVSCNELTEGEAVSIDAEIQKMNSAVHLEKDTIESSFETDFDKQKYFDQLSNKVISSEDIEV